MHRSRFWLWNCLGTLLALGAGCSILATRPVQEMSDTAAALKAAREAQADTLTPELFRQATEWHNQARREYKFKNFDLAIEYATKARSFAEQAEFDAIRTHSTQGGGTTAPLEAPPEPAQAQEAYPFPESTGTPAENLDSTQGPSPTPPNPSASPSTKPSEAPTNPVPVRTGPTY